MSGGSGTDTIVSDQSLAEVTTSTIDVTSIKISLAPQSQAFNLLETDESFNLTLSDLGYQSDIWRIALNRLVETRASEVGGLVGQVVLPLSYNLDGAWFDDWSLMNQTTLQIVDSDGLLIENYLPTWAEARAEADSILQAFQFDQANVDLSFGVVSSPTIIDADLSRLDGIESLNVLFQVESDWRPLYSFDYFAPSDDPFPISQLGGRKLLGDVSESALGTPIAVNLPWTFTESGTIIPTLSPLSEQDGVYQAVMYRIGDLVKQKIAAEQGLNLDELRVTDCYALSDVTFNRTEGVAWFNTYDTSTVYVSIDRDGTSLGSYGNWVRPSLEEVTQWADDIYAESP